MASSRKASEIARSESNGSDDLGDDLLCASSASELGDDLDGETRSSLVSNGTVVNAIKTIPDAVDRCYNNAGLKPSVEDISKTDLALTSVYSGNLAFEVGAVWAFGECQRASGISTGRIIVYAATENGALQKRAIQSHHSPTRPLHLFDNVLDRLEKDDRAELEKVQDKVRPL